MQITDQVPEIRRRALNDKGIDSDGEFVLYWMIAFRRPTYNFSLQRARNLALELDRPLVILEALRHGYPWACDRFHAFVLQGMADNQRAFEELPVTYYPFVETPEHPGSGLLEALAERACAVVTDDFPAFFLPRMLKAAAPRLEVMLEAVDSNGVRPMRDTDRLYSRAYDFRRYLHDRILEDARGEPLEWPEESPLEASATKLADPVELPEEIQDSWPPADSQWLAADEDRLATLPINHEIRPNPEFLGGWEAARSRMNDFMEINLDEYQDRRNKPSEAAESHLSPYLHFGHISAHRIFDAIRGREDWDSSDVDEEFRAKREGFWGMSPGPEAFVDQLLTWREIGFNRCALDPEGYDDFETLPDWAKKTLSEHEDDPRPQVYSLQEFEAADTHDELWNAAQMQLVTTGVLHNYMRMLWGKKILHWSKSPREALEIMVELNNKYAIDGRDPNSYSGIFWVLGRFDRAWGPEREVFGKIRYMTSKSTRRKFKVDPYIERYGG